jgi:thiamine monophosphate kinase
MSESENINTPIGKIGKYGLIAQISDIYTMNGTPQQILIA